MNGRIRVPSPLLLGALLLGSALAAPAAPRLDTAALDRFVAREMQDFNVPGVGLAVVQDGKIVYARGYGVRDVLNRRPVDADTQFAIGSVTKSFTALGMMQLVDRGLVKLDTPVVHYLPEFRLKDPQATRTVTVRHLLTHTTGLVRDDSGFANPNITVAEIMRDVARTPLAAAPGKVFIYSNANAVLAGEIIARVSGQSWQDYTREHILKPLGMAKSSFTQAGMWRSGNFATPTTEDALRGLRATPFYVLGARAAAGAINASPNEMARYLQFQLGNGAPLLKPQSLAAMHAPFISGEANIGPAVVTAAQAQAKQRGLSLPAAPIRDPGYAFFWGTERFLGERVVEHGGDTNGFTANASLIPAWRSGVVVLVNREHADLFVESVRWHVLQALMGRASDVDSSAALKAYLKVLGQDNDTHRADLAAARRTRLSDAALKALTGEYPALPGGSAVTVRRSGERFLRIRASMQGVTYDVELVPLGGGRFISNSQPLVGGLFSFVRQGNALQVVMNTPLGDAPLAQRPLH